MKTDKLYSQDYYQTSDSFLQRIVVSVSRFFEGRKIKRIKESGKILDVGCGDGGFLETCQKIGFEVFGQDTSAGATQLAKSRGLKNISNKDLWDCNFSDNYFDIITLRHVIEHIKDPRKLLEEIHKILKPGGVFLVSTPNADSFEAKLAGEKWFHQDPKRHIVLYTPKTLTSLLEKNGFQILKINHFASEYKHVIIYSILSFLGLGDLNPKLRQFLALILLPLGLPISYFFAFLGKSGTIEISAKKD